MEPENKNMLAAGKKSMVKRSGNALQDTANTISSTAKKAHSIFYEGYPCTYKNRYSNGDWLCNYKYNRGKTAYAVKLCKKLDRMCDKDQLSNYGKNGCSVYGYK